MKKEWKMDMVRMIKGVDTLGHVNGMVRFYDERRRWKSDIYGFVDVPRTLDRVEKTNWNSLKYDKKDGFDLRTYQGYL